MIPGYHQNKEHWNTVILDGSIPDKDIKRMIAESYDLITDSPTKRIYEAVKRIPKGHVATYGKVAEMAGNPKMSRAVGNVELTQIQTGQLFDLFQTIHQRIAVHKQAAAGFRHIQVILEEALDG